MASVTVVACGAPLASMAERLDICLQRHGWGREWIATPAALPWLAGQSLGNGVRSTPLPVEEPRAPLRRGALIVFPATFNTIGKLANGIADTYAHRVMCERLGLRVPFVLVPMVDAGLRRHPAWAANVTRLMAAGALFIDPVTGGVCADPDDLVDTPDPITAFDVYRLVTALKKVV